MPYVGGDFAGSSYNFYSVDWDSATSELRFVHKDASTDSYSHSFTIRFEYAKDTH
jgi:hypothetical protein